MTICTFCTFLQIEFVIILNKLFVLNVFENFLGLDSGNSSSKTNSKSYLKVGVHKNWRNLQTGNFQTITKTFNSHKVRLNWAMKLEVSKNTSLIHGTQQLITKIPANFTFYWKCIHFSSKNQWILIYISSMKIKWGVEFQLHLVEKMLNIQMETDVKEKHIINTPRHAYSYKEIVCVFMKNIALGNSGLETYLWFLMCFCSKKV